MTRLIRLLLLASLAAPVMAQTTGAPLNLQLPIEGSPGWGSKLNANSTAINAFAATVSAFPASGTGVLFYTSPIASRAATAADIGALFSGSSPCYLNKDGSCSAPPGLGVQSINSVTGAFTFTGSGVNCVSTTCTFSGAGTSAFSAITSGTNTTAAMLCGSGCSLAPTGTGTIQATNIASTITAGTNVTITGAGTVASPYSITATSTAATAFSALTGSTNTTAAMLCGTGCSLGATGSGTIAATSAPAAGLTGSTLASGVTASSLTSVGTIATGVWNGTLIAALKGGTGVANTASLTLGSSNQNWATLGTGIVKNTTTTGALSVATASDVSALYTGSSPCFLNKDGTCSNPSGSGTVTTSGTPTTGYLSLFTGSTVIGNSPIDYGITTASTVTSTAPIVVTGGSGNLLATGIVDGLTPIGITTATSTSLGGTYLTGYTFNNVSGGTAATTYTLPVAAAGKQYCARNDVGVTATLTLQTSASGQFIDNAGVNTASGGYVISGGALGDGACVIGIDATHWKLFITGGGWSTH